ncbi:unnamed protein product [Pleuronectes platessa]|uniref:Uncharacterized protein n=1 Tax=Pleuronectes platessa TaxID=8262 RepID=A0A9N7VLA8_PLEPL|nr:unnamed protein product [Pleuronectes platessa]
MNVNTGQDGSNLFNQSSKYMKCAGVLLLPLQWDSGKFVGISRKIVNKLRDEFSTVVATSHSNMESARHRGEGAHGGVFVGGYPSSLKAARENALLSQRGASLLRTRGEKECGGRAPAKHPLVAAVPPARCPPP